MSKNVWSGRFKRGIDGRLKKASYSLLVDHELLPAELKVNEAYAKMLAKVRLITSAEAKRLVRGLHSIGRNWKPGDACRLHDKYEDVHTLIEQVLEKKVGPVAKKLHTGRSRNDLVVTSTRLFLRGEAAAIAAEIRSVQRALIKLAKKNSNSIIAGLTHLRKAQPVLLAHHLLAYIEMLEEDLSRLENANKRLDSLPLGSASLGGSALPLDQKYLARQLGFSGVCANSMAAVSDRASFSEMASSLAILWVHLSRLAEDFILWNSEAFGYIELDDAFSTGSSLMPQKKNPDVFELLRGRSATITAISSALLGLQKGLPLTYNRDLQEDKPGLFYALRLTHEGLQVLAPTLATVKFREDRMKESLADDGLYATDVLEYLVKKKVPFREAHYAVGRLIAEAAAKGIPFGKLPLSVFRRYERAFDEDIYKLFNAERSVSGKKTIGSTHPVRVRAEIRKWETRLRK